MLEISVVLAQIVWKAQQRSVISLSH